MLPRPNKWDTSGMAEWGDQLERLAARVSSLEDELTSLEQQNERLRAQLGDEPGDEHGEEPEAPVLDRRAILRFGGVAVAAGAGSALLRPQTAEAATANMQYGAENDAGTSGTGLTSSHDTDTLHVTNTSTGAALRLDATPNEDAFTLDVVSDGGGPAISGEVTNATADPAPPAIVGMGIDGGGVLGITGGGGPAIGGLTTVGQGSSFTGVVFGPDSGAANPFAAFVDASESGFLSRIYGATSDARAIQATQEGTESAVYASVTNGSSGTSAIIGRTDGSGAGVDGRSSKGTGGRFSGKTSQITLVPSTASTHPTSGSAGQLFVDRSKRLWFCKGGTNWKQLA
jgi:hypothetical protein